MSLVFTNAVLLPFLALLLAPLILHLFARARPPRYPFSSVEFLRKVARKSIRLKRPQSLLVLFLRTLLFAALIGLFLKPLFFGHQRLPGLASRRNVVLLVDATASMAAVEGTQTRFAMACARAAEVLSELGASDTANVIWLGTPNRAVFPQLGVNFTHLVKVLRQAAVTSESADVNAGFSLAAEMLAAKEGTREIYLLSDFQTGTWAGAQPSVSPGIQVHAVRLGQASLANAALSSVTVDPSNPMVGQEITVLCEVRNFSPDHSLGTVYLSSGETHQSRELRLTPWQKTSVAFHLRCPAPGEQAVSVSLSEDAFPYDNQQWIVFEGVNQLKVGIFDAEPQTAAWWRRAVNALGWARAEPVTESQLQTEIDFDALMLAGWTGTGAAQSRVKAYLENGGAVIWYPPPTITLPAIAALPGLVPPPGGTGSAVWESGESPFKLTIADPANRIFKVFAKGTYGDPARGAFTSRLRLLASMMADGKVILAYRDGVPALGQLRDQVKLLLWNLPLQREYSDWALQPEFLPFLGELLLSHRRPGPAATLHAFTPGQMLVRDFDQEVLDTDVQLDRDGVALKVTRQSGAGIRFASAEARAPGLYAWRFRGRLLAQQAVNFPAVESDLRTQPPPRFAEGSSLSLAAGQSMRSLREGTPIWPQLLTAALALMLIEGLVLLRTDRT